MGNCVQERKTHQTLFDSQELFKLNSAFDHYCDLRPNTRKNRQLCQLSFEEIFVENPEFGRKLFKFLEVYSEKEKYIGRDALFFILEVLLKDSSSLQELKNLNKIEIFCLISLKSWQYLKNKEELHNYKITYLDAMTIINDILRIRLSGDRFQEIDEKASKALLDSIFKQENGIIDWFELIKHLRIRLGGLSGILKLYFKDKFMLIKQQISIPTLNTNSYLLNDDLLFQLQLSAYETKLKNSIRLDLLYSNLVHQGGFNEMVNNIINSGLPTLFLIQHEEKYQALIDKSMIQKIYTFGAISNLRWFDSAIAQGDNKDCLFSLYPYYQLYFPKKERTAGRNFCYLNTKDTTKPQGIGFGQDDNQFRIWIDKDLRKSSCTSEDASYEQGDLVHKHIKKLQISIIEVWGIVHSEPEEQIDISKVANAEPLFQFQQEDYITEQQAQNNQESKADYYWVNKEQIQETKNNQNTNNFYWNNPSTLQNQSTTYQLSKSQPNIQSTIKRDQQIANRLIGNQVITQDIAQQSFHSPLIEEEQKSATLTRRSNVQRPKLDIQTKSRSTYNPETTTKQNLEIKQQNIIFGSTIEETKYVTHYVPSPQPNPQSQDQQISQKSIGLREKKTAEQIIQDYESRKSSHKIQ